MRAIMGTLNSVELIGWMGGDPEVRNLANGAKVCRFNVATRYYSRSNGEQQLETQWIAVEAWEQLAERCNTYLHRGSRVLVRGSLRTDAWTDKESGQNRSRSYVRAGEIIFLDGRSEASTEEAELVAENEE